MTKENKVKFGIAGLFLFICCILFLIVYLNTNEEQPNLDNNNPFQMEKVTEYTYFFSVISTINQYLNYSSAKNSIGLYNLLDDEYKIAKNITNTNILSKLTLYENTPSFKAKEMYFEQNGSNNLYFTTGDIMVTEFEESKVIKENAKFFVIIDYNNLSVSIYPVEEDLEEIPIVNKEKSISLNSNNHMSSTSFVTESYICNLYFSDFLEKLVTNTLDSYQRLEEDFMNTNYPSKESYEQFIQNNLESISMEISSCNLSTKNKERTYKLVDANNNTFIFREESIMNYKVSFQIN